LPSAAGCSSAVAPSDCGGVSVPVSEPDWSFCAAQFAEDMLCTWPLAAAMSAAGCEFDAAETYLETLVQGLPEAGSPLSRRYTGGWLLVDACAAGGNDVAGGAGSAADAVASSSAFTTAEDTAAAANDDDGDGAAARDCLPSGMLAAASVAAVDMPSLQQSPD